MTDGWRLVISSIISALVAVVVFIIKDEISSKENVKVSARLMAVDIKKIQIILGNIVKMNFTPPFNHLSILSDWRKDFYNVSRRLDGQEAEVYKLIYNDDTKSKERKGVELRFMVLCKELLEEDMGYLIRRLEEEGA